MSEKIDMFQPPLGGPTDKDVAKAEAILKARKDAIDERDRNTLIRCTSQIATGKGCRELHPVGELEYIQTYFYVGPRGCTGGDYWLEGEGRWVCPSCGHVNRLHASPEIEALKWKFRSVNKVYKD